MKFLLIVVGFFTISYSLQAQSSASTESVNTVKVEKPNQYSNQDDLFNIRFEPFMLLFQEFTATMQIKLSDKFSLGPLLAYMPGSNDIYAGGSKISFFPGDQETTRFTVGLRSNFYFKNAKRHTPYISATLAHTRTEIEDDRTSFATGSQKGGVDFHETYMTMTGGFQWIWQAFTLNVGGGFKYFIDTPNDVTFAYNDGSTRERNLDGALLAPQIDVGLGVSF